MKNLIVDNAVPMMSEGERRLPTAQQRLIDDAADIWSEDARSAGALTFWPRALLQVTLPHNNPGEVPAWGRRCGDFFLVVEPGHRIDRDGRIVSYGFPFGSLPRLILSHLNKQVKLTGKPTIDLGDSLSAFMHELGLGAQTGGHNGSITRLRRQTIALLRSKLAFGYEPGGGERGKNQIIANDFELWWDSKSVDQMSFYPNWVTLSEPVFEEMLRYGVPLDMRALRALKRSPLALDLYAWSAYRNHNRKGQVAIPWDSLARQFGAEYADCREFARYAKAAFRKIQAINPDLVIAFERGRCILGSSNLHSVPKSFPKNI